MARLIVPYIIDFQQQAEEKEKIASLINLQKMLEQYKVTDNSKQYPRNLSVFKVNSTDFIYNTDERRKKYIVSTKLDFDSDGEVDDYLYVSSSQFGVEKKLDADNQPTLSLVK